MFFPCQKGSHDLFFKTNLKEIQIGMIEDGTAIGMAIANCVNRLRTSKSKSKVVILLTDGRNNRGELDPLTAAQLAKTMNVRIYTIGAGKRGEALYPIDDPFLGKRYVYFCPNCKSVLGVSHRKGFWMG